MPRFAFQSLWTVVPIFCGIFLPTIGPTGERYVCLFWSLVFGLSDCVFIWVPYSLAHPSPFFEIAAFGWPLLVAVFLAWISGIVWDRLHAVGRWVAIAVLVFLCSSIVPFKRAQQSPFDHWPTYQTVMASLW